jgi:predicted AlkP superfamily phosphohydrolase/phosphomutase
MNKQYIFKALLLAAVLMSLLPGQAFAYIGPGAGFAFVGSALVLVAAILMAIVTLITFPLRMLWKGIFGSDPYKDSKINRVVILGLDGLDPELTEHYMEQGMMPNLAKLRQQGGSHKLRTTFPGISPVAWSSFSTGCNPGKHNIFDFLSRDEQTYLPDLSSVSIGTMTRHLHLGIIKIPMGQKPSIEGFRRSESFWKYLGEKGIGSQIIRVPITFPPDDFKGLLLSAMCVPDLRGTQGTFTLYTTDKERVAKAEGGVFVHTPLQRENGRRAIKSAFLGPDAGGEQEAKVSGGYAGGSEMSGELDPTALKSGFTLTLKDDENAILELEDEKIKMKAGEYTDWVTIPFKAGSQRITGIALLMFTVKGDNVELYCSPINIDPRKPALPISNPQYYAIYLAKLMGPFATLGLCEDTWALEENAITDKAFLEQTYKMGEEREKQFFKALETTRKGLVVTVFDETDRIQHMFWRYRKDGYKGLREKADDLSRDAIENLYKHADDMVGRTMERLNDDDLLLVMSDHGFKGFNVCVHFNNWLYENGYLHLKEGKSEGGEWFKDIDWSKTRAYGFGLNGIYLNIKGRESQGIVEPGEEEETLKAEIIEKLTGLKDPRTGETAINQAFDTRKIYVGPYKDNGPDILVGTNDGYRVAWSSVTGTVGGDVFYDNTKAWSGDHCVDPRLVPGILYSNWKINADNPRILDIAPTILDLFGIKPPAHMDGRPMDVEIPDHVQRKKDKQK